MLDLGNIDLMIWDLDGVIYIIDDKDVHNNNLHTIFGEAINKLNSNISAKRGLEIINEYYPQDPANFYHNLERDFGLNRFELEDVFHRMLVEKIDFVKNGYIDDESTRKFKSLTPKHIILTQSHKIWAEKILSNSNLLDNFEDIIASEITLEKPKMADNDLYLQICNELNISPERAVMVEDSYKNLKSAKKHGLKTVYFNYDKEINEDYIDYQYRDIIDFLSKI